MVIIEIFEGLLHLVNKFMQKRQSFDSFYAILTVVEAVFRRSIAILEDIDDNVEDRI